MLTATIWRPLPRVAFCHSAMAQMSHTTPRINAPSELFTKPEIPNRLLMGPGPSNMTSEIQRSQSQQLLGHLHPEFIQIMDDVKEGVKYAFQTNNSLTFVVSGTGHAGMECALLNLLDRDDKLLVLESGIWGTRAADLGDRLGLDVTKVTSPLGEPVSFQAVKEAIEKHHPKVVFVCHGESSTGVRQPLEGIGDLCHKHGALFLVDTVASLAGTPFDADQLEVDCVYTATQKVLNAPPGMAPISFSARAMDSMRARSKRVASFYFDAFEIGNYWGCFDEARRYHHTAPISTVYALRAALAALAEEGLAESLNKHATNAELLYNLMEEAGLEPFVVKKEWRLPCLTTIRVPEGVEWKVVMSDMLDKGIEIAGGLGPTAGKIWRVGTFGANSNPHVIRRLFTQLQKSIAIASR